MLADARKTKEVGYAERLANVLILDRTTIKLVPAGFSSVYTRKSKSSLNTFANMKSGRILCRKEKKNPEYPGCLTNSASRFIRVPLISLTNSVSDKYGDT